jgi:hypothetical protein
MARIIQPITMEVVTGAMILVIGTMIHHPSFVLKMVGRAGPGNLHRAISGVSA